jgi:hypothetical protein
MGVGFEEGAEVWMRHFMPDGIPERLQFMIDNGLGPEDMGGEITASQAQRE